MTKKSRQTKAASDKLLKNIHHMTRQMNSVEGKFLLKSRKRHLTPPPNSLSHASPVAG
jgi:hypothetical protein